MKFKVIIPLIVIIWFIALLPACRTTSANEDNELLTEEDAMVITDEVIKLPAPAVTGSMSLEEAVARRRSERSYRGDALSITQIGQMLWAAQGITSEARSFRAAPSAGATYPLELYVAAGRVNRLRPGLYRYDPSDHSLTLTVEGDLRDELAAAALNQQMLRNAPVSFIITADYSRTAGRYGDRAVRYVHMEVGHAAQNLNLQAITLGLGSVMVGAFNDSNIKSIMKLPDNEDPLYILPVGRPAQ